MNENNRISTEDIKKVINDLNFAYDNLNDSIIEMRKLLSVQIDHSGSDFYEFERVDIIAILPVAEFVAQQIQKKLQSAMAMIINRDLVRIQNSSGCDQ